MATLHDEMWEKLNLDLEGHAGLLEVLGKFYGDIYMSQSGRLKGMEYLDFVLSEVLGLRIKELQDAKAQGKKIIGTRNIRDLVEDKGETVEELLEAVIDRYMRIDCACFTPNMGGGWVKPRYRRSDRPCLQFIH